MLAIVFLLRTLRTGSLTANEASLFMTTSRVTRGRVSHSASFSNTAAVLKTFYRLSMIVLMISMSTSISLAQTGNLVTAPIDTGDRVVFQGRQAAWARRQNSSDAAPADIRRG